MRLTYCFAAIAAILFTSTARADFDATTGTVKTTDGAIAFRFEAAESTARVATEPADSQSLPTFDQGGLPDAWRVKDAIEGAGAVRVPAGKMLVLGDLATLGPIQKTRLELPFWAKADGPRQSGTLLLARAEVAAIDLLYPTAAIQALETGRATSDGWVEYATGPLDGSVGSHVAAAVVFEADTAPTGGGFLVDAVELRKVADL